MLIQQEEPPVPAVDMTQDEWQRILTMLSRQPWLEANPLLMKITQQLAPQPTAAPSDWDQMSKQQTNSGTPEVPMESAKHDPPRRGHRP